MTVAPFDPQTAALTPFNPLSLGVDIRLPFGDIGGIWGLASGFDCLGNDLVARTTTPPGGLFYDDDYGYDVLGLLNATFTQAQIQKEQQAYAAEIEKDPRVRSCQATFTFNTATQNLFINARIVLITGQRFDLVILASQVTVAILSVNGILTPAAATAPTSVQLVVGPPGGDGPAGPAGAAGAAGTPQVTLDFWENDGFDDSGTEQLAYERLVNFTPLAGTLTAELVAYVSSAGGAALFKLRLGGTKGLPDGTVLASFSTASGSPVALNGASSPFANPGGLQLVKVTQQSSANTVGCTISDRTVTIR